MLVTSMRHVWLYLVKTKMSGSIEKNPRKIKFKNLSYTFYEIISSTCVHFIHIFDILCLSETFTGVIISSNNGNLVISNMESFPSDIKRGSIF